MITRTEMITRYYMWCMKAGPSDYARKRLDDIYFESEVYFMATAYFKTRKFN